MSAEDHLEGFELEFDKTRGNIDLSLAFNDPRDFSLPYKRRSSDKVSVNYAKAEMKITIDKESLKDREGFFLIVEASTQQKNDINVEVKVINKSKRFNFFICLFNRH